MMKRFIIDPCGLRFSEDGKQGIDTRFNRPFAEKVGAKTVNRADLRFFEPTEGVIEPGAVVGSARGSASGLFEGFAQTELQLSRAFSVNVTATISVTSARPVSM